MRYPVSIMIYFDGVSFGQTSFASMLTILVWISVSVPIDMAIMSVPIRILNRTSLRQHEKRILRMVFCATLLGTVTW